MQGVKHITTVTSTTEGFAIAILVLVAGALISLIAAHLIDRGVDPLRDAVSDFGAREHPWPYRIAAVWLGLAGLLLAVALADAVFPKPTLTILLLLVFAATRWAITIFPTDIEGEESTSVGHSHTVLAALAFGAIAFAALAFSFEVRLDQFWAPHRSLLTIEAVVMLVIAGATGLERALKRPAFGLVERFYYLTMFAWLSTVAVLLLGG